MAKKRMFRLDVLETDAFMDMPLTTQALYFHLCMRADDDGFVGNPKMITRNIGASIDDLKLLITKRFALMFEDGVIVIKHWRLHNNLTSNRYQETKYIEHKDSLFLKDNGAYSETTGEKIDDSHYIAIGKRQTKQRRDIDEAKTTPDKISIDKNSIDIDNPPYNPPTEFDEFWVAYPKKVGKADARKAFAKAIKNVDLDTMLNAISVQKESDQWSRDNGKYIPNPSTWLNQGRWDDELAPKGVVTKNGRAVRDDAFWDRMAKGDLGI